MTEERMALVELLQKSGDGDFLRAVAEAVLQILMEADVEGLIGAGRHERSSDRLNYRNGYRERSLDTRLGSLSLRIPKLRQGSYFLPFLEPRKTAEKALVTVIQEAWIGGVSTRRVHLAGRRSPLFAVRSGPGRGSPRGPQVDYERGHSGCIRRPLRLQAGARMDRRRSPTRSRRTASARPVTGAERGPPEPRSCRAGRSPRRRQPGP